MAKRLVYGDEPYLVRQYKKEVAKGIELPEMNLMASDAFGEEELRFLQQPPLCSERKVLLLEMPQLKINPELSAYWKNPTETSDVVVVADRIDKRTTDFKSFRSEEIQLCNKLGKGVLEKTILQYVKKNGAKIKQSAYQTLLERLNYHDNEDVNLFTVFHVLNRLCPLREITRELVVSAVRDNAKENAFRLTHGAGHAAPHGRVVPRSGLDHP